MKNDILLSGVRPGATDGVKVRYFPSDGHIRVSMLSRAGAEILGFELDGIDDLSEIRNALDRAIARHKELYPVQESYLTEVRRVLAPQTQDHMTTILNA